MTKKNNKKCIVCGTKYTYCPTCAEFANVEVWHNIYHDKNCKEIFEIATDFNAKALDKDVAKERLGKCDLSNKKSFHNSILKAINEINEIVDEVKVKDVIVEPVEFVEPVDVVKEVNEISTETEKFEENYKEKKYNKKFK